MIWNNIWKRTSQFYSPLPLYNVRRWLVLQAKWRQVLLTGTKTGISANTPIYFKLIMSFYEWWYFTSKPSIEIPGFHTFAHKEVSASPLEKKKKSTFLLYPVFCKQILIINIKLSIFPQEAKCPLMKHFPSSTKNLCIYWMDTCTELLSYTMVIIDKKVFFKVA